MVTVIYVIILSTYFFSLVLLCIYKDIRWQTGQATAITSTNCITPFLNVLANVQTAKIFYSVCVCVREEKTDKQKERIQFD